MYAKSWLTAEKNKVLSRLMIDFRDFRYILGGKVIAVHWGMVMRLIRLLRHT